jgi:RNA polymerase sigma factor (sigma-70 family)
MAAEREKRSVSQEIWQMENSFGKRLSNLLSNLEKEVTDKEFKEAEKKSCIQSIANATNFLAQVLVATGRLQIENTEKDPKRNYKEKLYDAFQLQKFLKTHFVSKQVSLLPIFILYKKLSNIIWEGRILRRYLHSRFGIKRTFSKVMQKKAYRNEKTFAAWISENYKGRLLTDEEIERAHKELKLFRHNEKQLKDYAETSLTQNAVKLITCKSAMLISNELFSRKSEYVRNMVEMLESFEKEMEVSRLSTDIKLKREFSLDYIRDLINISALFVNKISLRQDISLKKTLEVERSGVLDKLLDVMPGSVLIALDESSEENSKLFRRVEKLLKAELPLEDKHKLQQQQRQRREKGKNLNSGNNIKVSEGIPVVEQMAEANVQNFTLKEEARIDLLRLFDVANLSSEQKQVVQLVKFEGLTETETAKVLNIPLGTVRSRLARAKKKLTDLKN